MGRTLQKQDRGAKQREKTTPSQGAKFSHDGNQGANSSVQRVPFSHTSIQGAKNFAPCETPPGTRVPFRTPQAHFRTVRNKVRKFRTPLFKVRKSQFKVHQFRTPQSKVRKIFAPCETLSWHTSAISHTSSPFSHRAKQDANSSVQSMEISHDAIQGAKFSF